MLKKYNELFIESGILERIIPRNVKGPKEFKDFNQYVLNTDKDFEESDLVAVNDVSKYSV